MSVTNDAQRLARHAIDVIPGNGLVSKLRAARGQPLTVKLGLDPTSPDIHLGHTVVLRKLREFQDAGHRVVLIVGDFTARIGDPSGQSKTRPRLSDEIIHNNAKSYQEQATKILDPDRKKLSIRFNSEWLGKLTMQNILELMATTTVGQVLAREDFHARFKLGQPIGLHELLYPLMQAYDSVAIKADIELGGTDQKFNLLVGRELQEHFGQPPQLVMTMPVIAGTDGKKKMSKSLGNAIGITEAPSEMYGQIMSLPDHVILPYFALTTDIGDAELLHMRNQMKQSDNPVEHKHRLAFELTKLYSSEQKARQAQEIFRQTFQKRAFPESAETLKIGRGDTLLALCEKHKLFSSNSEARRKIKEGAITIDGLKVNDPNMELQAEEGAFLQLRIGKKKFYRVSLDKKSRAG